MAAAYIFGVAAGSLAPAILGRIATSYSMDAGLLPLAISFFAVAPLFLLFAYDTSRTSRPTLSAKCGTEPG